jgi:hypothetical protein
MWEIRLYGSGRGWSATLERMKYCGTAGKPGGKQRKQTTSYNHRSLQPTRIRSIFDLDSRYQTLMDHFHFHCMIPAGALAFTKDK